MFYNGKVVFNLLRIIFKTLKDEYGFNKIKIEVKILKTIKIKIIIKIL